MTPEQKIKELKKLARSPQGQALKEELEERILKMKDLSSIKSWEETLGKKFATEILEGIMRKLDLIKEDIPKNTKEDYS